MSKVQWIKITTDIFNDEKMMLIESMPDSDSLIVIWFKLLALAGKSNNGGLVMISETVPYTQEMLATIFRRKLTVVILALKTFQEFGMIEIVDQKILISNWEKHQNVKGLDTIREKNRIRQQRYRDNKKTLLLENKEIEEDKELDIESNVTHNVTNIISYLNQKNDTSYKSTSRKTQGLIKARFNEGFTLENFYTVIDNKYNDWYKTDYMKYLRPETLFGTKFEGYLNQKDNKAQTKFIDDFDKI